MKIETDVKAGSPTLPLPPPCYDNQTIARGLRVKTNIKAGLTCRKAGG